MCGIFLIFCRSSFVNNFIVIVKNNFFGTLTLKRMGGRGNEEGSNLTPFLWFFGKCISKKRVRLWFFVTFNIYHKSHLSCKFHWDSSCLSEVMKNFSVNISYFHQFSSIFWIFWHFLVTKKLMTSLITNHVIIFSLSTYVKKIV